ncbi:MAG: cytochrome c biogenesis protein CcdA [candidate division WOR-3 bacterium]|nr:cytochrome c biogenesis protein CcdA [candidate division WOR-3 bacterium]
MEGIFSYFTGIMYSSALLAIAGAFAWGVLSILLSPCHLASIPLIIGYVSRNETKNTYNGFIMSLLFSIGILLSIFIVGIITYLTGNLIGDVGMIGNIIVSMIFIIVGLYFLDIVTLDFIGISQKHMEGKAGKRGAFILGLIFGIGLGPCTFAFMAPVMGLVLSNAYSSVLISLMLIIAYAIGHCLLIVISGTATGFVQRTIDFNAKSKTAFILKKSIGVIIILAGIYWFYKSF